MAALAAAALTVSLSVASSTSTIDAWSGDLWTQALQGNLRGVQDALKSVPDGDVEDAAKSLRESAEQYQAHLADAAAAKVEARTKALAEIGEKDQAGKFLEALNAAIKVQTISDDWSADIKRPEVKAIIAQADAMMKQAKEEGQWLIAQELLVRLRLLHEDRPDLFSLFKSYDEQLKEVARRVALIAQFAPHKLYELNKSLSAKFLPDREIPPYKESLDDRWQDQVKDITQIMLREALKLAADGHIDAGGWAPLLEGGLEAVKILGTTETIAETLPSLADKSAVAAWVAAVEEQEAFVNSRREVLSKSDYNTVITNLLRANERTIKLKDPGIILHEFGDGATSELERRYADPYSEIIWPARFRRFQQQVEGSFTGVGIMIRNDEKRTGIVVVNPIEGAPAHRSGVKSGDLITTVNGESTAGWSLNKAVDVIMGPKKTPVTLGLEREGTEGLVSITMLRDIIPIRSVNGWWKKGLSDDGVPQWDWMIDPASRIGYVRLTSFNENTFDDLQAAIHQMQRDGKVNGLILDLRFNPGGLLTSAVQVCNMFVPKGIIVSCEDRNGREQDFRAAEANKAEYKSLPLVVLVNEGSASASEIVAGCLQAHDAAVVVGARSFGKGSVQTVHTIGPSAQLKLTTQHYVLPPRPGDEKGRLVHKKPGSTDWGVNPNIVVAMSPDQIEKAFELREKSDIIPDKDAVNAGKEPAERPDVKELVTKGIDPQLETALLILRARALKSLNEQAIASSTK
jgi:carboxyl-terminal processing protease